MSGSAHNAIIIPLNSQQGTVIEFFPDELPSDFNDLKDVLRAEFAPLVAWRQSAVEYYKQNFYSEFEWLLKEIIQEFGTPSVEEFYRGKQNYKEDRVALYNTYAAYALVKFWKSAEEEEATGDRATTSKYAQQVVSFIQLADHVDPGFEFSWLLRGFYDLRQSQGEFSSAKNTFNSVLSSAKTKSSAIAAKFTYGALMGLGVIAYNERKYDVALEHFNQCILSNPAHTRALVESDDQTVADPASSRVGANLRVALSTCFYHLGAFEQSTAAAELAIKLDPSNVNALILLGLLEHVNSVASQQAVGVLATTKGQKSKGRKAAVAYGKHWQNSYEYMRLAAASSEVGGDSGSYTSALMTCNHLANHYFHTWYTISTAASVVGERTVQFPVSDAQAHALSGGDDAADPLVDRFDSMQLGNFGCSVTEINLSGGICSLTLSADAPTGTASGAVVVKVKRLNRLKKLVSSCIERFGSNTTAASHTLNGLLAESHYILGRLFHSQISGNSGGYAASDADASNVKNAIYYYEQSLILGGGSSGSSTNCSSTVIILAMFQLGQLYLSKHMYKSALDMFQKTLLLQQSQQLAQPGDQQGEIAGPVRDPMNSQREIQAYILHVSALDAEEICGPFEKLESILTHPAVTSTSFPFLYDAWLLQATLRVGTGADMGPEGEKKTTTAASERTRYIDAIRCYLRAAECIVTSAVGGAEKHMDLAQIYGAVASVYHHLGNASRAREFSTKALAAVKTAHAQDGTVETNAARVVFHQAANAPFFDWTAEAAQVRIKSRSGDTVEFEQQPGQDGGRITTAQLFVGDDVDIDGVVCRVAGIVSAGGADGGAVEAMDVEAEVEADSMYGDIVDKKAAAVAIAKVENIIAITVESPLLLLLLPTDVAHHTLKLKEPNSVFCEDCITLCYNQGRILEACGETMAAVEVYTNILMLFPTFVDCYLRLAIIQKCGHRYDAAMQWVTKAVEMLARHEKQLAAESSSALAAAAAADRSTHFNDCHVLMGEIQFAMGQVDAAKKTYNQLVKIRPDPLAMVHLGQLNYISLHSIPSSGSHATVAAVARYDTLFKDSYKFFHNVLSSSGVPRNMQAASGLGGICAEKKHLDAARQIYTTLREADMGHNKVIQAALCKSDALVPSKADCEEVSICSSSSSTVTEDVTTNLAHTCMLQQRYAEALTLYNIAYKAVHMFGAGNVASANKGAPIAKAGPGAVVNTINPDAHRTLNGVVSLLECIACAHLKLHQYAEAAEVLFKSLHMDPSAQQTVFNLAYINEEHGLFSLVKKGGKGGAADPENSTSVAEVESAIVCFDRAHHYYAHLAVAQQRLIDTGVQPPTSFSTCCLSYIFNGAHSRRQTLDLKQVDAHANYCGENSIKAVKILKRARADEEVKAGAEAQLANAARSALEERQRKLEEERAVAEENRRLQQEKAQQKLQHLEKLQEGWASEPAAKAARTKKANQSGAADHVFYDSEEEGDGNANALPEPEEPEMASSSEEEPDDYVSSDDAESEGEGAAGGEKKTKKLSKAERKAARKAARKAERRALKQKRGDDAEAVAGAEEAPVKKRKLISKADTTTDEPVNDPDDIFGGDDSEEEGAAAPAAPTATGGNLKRRGAIADEEEEEEF